VPPGQTYGPGGGGGRDSGGHGKDPSGEQSDPVNSLTGAYVTQATDAQMPGVGMGFSFVRSYTSADDTEGELGRGWTHAYAARLVLAPSGEVTFRSGTGQRLRFRPRAGGYAPAAGVLSRLERTAAGFELVTREDVHYRFDPTGLLREVADRNENTTSLGYGPARRLTRITDTVGRTVALDHDARGRLSRLSLPTVASSPSPTTPRAASPRCATCAGGSPATPTTRATG